MELYSLMLSGRLLEDQISLHEGKYERLWTIMDETTANIKASPQIAVQILMNGHTSIQKHNPSLFHISVFCFVPQPQFRKSMDAAFCAIKLLCSGQ